MPQEEHPPLGEAYVLGFDMSDRNYPIIARSVDPNEDGYALPALFDACPEPWCASNLFVEVRPTNSDQRVLWIYRILPGPIIQSSAWDQENRVLVYSFWRSARYDATPPAVASTYSTGTVMRHNSISSLSVTDPGNNYISIPTIAIEVSEGGGTNATATVTSLQLVEVVISVPGSGYVQGNTLTVPGGTFSVAATLTVSLVGISTLAVDTAGIDYLTNDFITLGGGVYSGPATVRVSSTILSIITVNAAGTGQVPGATLTLVNGSATWTGANTATVTSTKVVSATVATPGSGGTNGVQTVTGTTGTGTKFTASVNVVGGAIDSVISILTGGIYTVNPASLTNAPVSGPGPLTGAELNIVMGANVVTPDGIASFTVEKETFTSTGGGNDVTLNGARYEIATVEVIGAGSYSTAAANYTQVSTTGSGLGAVFNGATYIITGLTVANPGVYTVIPTGSVSVTGGSGTGMQVLLNFGIGVVALTNGGTGYYSDFPTITLSYGNGQITAIMDALAPVTGLTGYVRSNAMQDTENEFIKRMAWEMSAIPPFRKSQPYFPYEFPALFVALTNEAESVPSPGYDYNLTPHRRAVYPGRETINFSIVQRTNLPRVFQMISPAAASRLFPIPANTAHGTFIWARVDADGAIRYRERFQASTRYQPGDIIVVLVEQKQVFGCFWMQRVIFLSELSPLY